MAIIGVVDSGLGGISTLSAILKVLPNEDYIYACDKSFMPYGGKDSSLIAKRLLFICGMLKKEGCNAIVIACNTATSAGIDYLRKSNDGVIYVGVEPAIKPAIKELKWGKVLLLCTPFTADGHKLNALLSTLNKDKIIISPQKDLATQIENNIGNLSALKQPLRRILFAYSGIESIVLGCTHYCLLRHLIYGIMPAKIYDGNLGTALRLYSLLKEGSLICRKPSSSIQFIRF